MVIGMLDFLSRLCGGEVFFGLFNRFGFFLSRLCGGEENLGGIGEYKKLSKPPMWR